MDTNQLRELLDKYLTNSMSGSERELLHSLMEEPSQRESIMHIIESDFKTRQFEYQDDDLIKHRIWMGVEKPIKLESQIHFLKTAWFRSAAAVLIILAGAYLWISQNKQKNPVSASNPLSVQNDIAAPSALRASLTLANGKTVFLDTAANGTVSVQGNTAVEKTSEGRIVYTAYGNENTLQYNTLSVPRGSRVASIVLSDGTLVFLNSASSIRYPVSFPANERRVEITGEAYFEVAKNARKKFLVTGNGVITEVLGTHFNVNTYTDEGEKEITLLEGSVLVRERNSALMLNPGEQASIKSEKIYRNKNVDLDQVVAWKNGKFNFDNTNLEVVMRALSRWYDVNIFYPKGVPQIKFGGEIQRSLPLSEMLSGLRSAGINCELNGKNITVLP